MDKILIVGCSGLAKEIFSFFEYVDKFIFSDDVNKVVEDFLRFQSAK